MFLGTAVREVNGYESGRSNDGTISKVDGSELNCAFFALKLIPRK